VVRRGKWDTLVIQENAHFRPKLPKTIVALLHIMVVVGLRNGIELTKVIGGLGIHSHIAI